MRWVPDAKLTRKLPSQSGDWNFRALWVATAGGANSRAQACAGTTVVGGLSPFRPAPGTSFVEFTRPDAPPDQRKWARLRAHADDLGLPFDGEERMWFGSRPTLPDCLPAIGRSTRDPRVLYAFGHQHLGLTLGPVTGEIVAALATGERPSVDAAPYAIERFG